MAAFSLSANTNRKQRKYAFGPDRVLSMCVYAITHRETGKAYVGQSVGKVARRWAAHINKSGAGVSAIKAAIKKYGYSAFDFEVIDIAETRECLDHKERFWISERNTLAPFGYNFCDGGSGGRVFSAESRKKMSESARAKNGPDFVPNGIVAQRKRRSLAEKAARIAAGNASKRGKPTWLSLNGVTPEMREKGRVKKLGVPLKKKWKPVVRDDGVEYESVGSAAIAIGCDRRAVTQSLRRGSRVLYKYRFFYKENDHR